MKLADVLPRKALGAFLLLLSGACGGAEGDSSSSGQASDSAPTSAEIDATLQARSHQGLLELPIAEDRACAACHADIVQQWKLHGMADTLGPLDLERQPAAPDPRWLQNQQTGYAYRMQPTSVDASVTPAPWMLEAFRDPPAQGWPGYQQKRPVDYRIGAGVAAMSFVMRESQRWFFAPIEFYTGHGWEPAPQELGLPAGHLRHAITGECLSCHSDTRAPETYPLHALGDFEPQPLGCATCHGSGQEHIALMESDGPQPEDLKVLYPGDWTPSVQVDLCARCHLEGDAMIDFELGLPHPDPGATLADHRAVWIAQDAGGDFRFVSQVQRMAMSECFQESQAMTCTTCHNPHLPPRMQSVVQRNQACVDCHSSMVETHDKGANCVTCHMPRRQPFDLPHVRIADHNIGIHPTYAEDEVLPFRPVESPEGQWKLFTQRPLDALPFSEREKDGLKAMALMEKGHHARAQVLFDSLPKAGTAAAIQRLEGESKPGVLRLPQFHFLRGRSLTASQRPEEAIAAYRDALRLDADLAEAAINLAWLLREAQQTEEAGWSGETLAERFPLSEASQNVLFSLAMDQGNHEKALEAAYESLRRNPDQAALLQAIGRIHAQAGRLQDAQRYLIEAFRHEPDLPGLPEDIATVSAQLK
ncbi:MAG: cytochrome c3 family protein [Planctomycetota bacterium]